MRPDVKETITFSFGENWLAYLTDFDQQRFNEARASVVQLLDADNLNGRSFLDIGFGSGLFSAVAVSLQAGDVTSVDIDPKSVEAACRLRSSIGDPANWTVLSGSILDADFTSRLGPADVVYSWGVLHHTGNMWQAIANTCSLVNPGGQLVLAIYNRTRLWRFWLAFKRAYNRGGGAVKALLVWFLLVPRLLARLLLRKPLSGIGRGMSLYHDAVDWAGGLPYECAAFEEIAEFCTRKGFVLVRCVRTNSSGCNQYVFRKAAPQA